MADWGEGEQDAPAEEGGGTEAAEGDATWEANALGDSEWETPGGDFAEEPSAEADVGGTGSTVVWEDEGLVADVQSWVDGDAENLGWILLGDESATQTAKRFLSSDNEEADGGQRPRLVIIYQRSEE